MPLQSEMRKLNTGFFQKDGYFNIFSIVEPWFDKLFIMSIFNFYAFRIEVKDSLCMAILDDCVLEFFEFIKKMMLILIVALINNDNYTKNLSPDKQFSRCTNGI